MPRPLLGCFFIRAMYICPLFSSGFSGYYL
nr:MAG TPA: hypothetical protein [Caudoviricetes sp.]